MNSLPKQPLIAVDVVPLAATNTQLTVATAIRQYEPFQGQHALPGVLLGAGESLTMAAYRALASKAKLDHHASTATPLVRHLFQIGAFDGSNRDPRQHAIAIGFVAILHPETTTDSSTPDRAWWPSHEVPPLPFDHQAIVAEGLDQVRTRLWRDDAITRALTGDWFTTSQAVHLTETVTGAPVHHSNLRRTLAHHPHLNSGPSPHPGTPGRKPLGWTWS